MLKTLRYTALCLSIVLSGYIIRDGILRGAAAIIQTIETGFASSEARLSQQSIASLSAAIADRIGSGPAQKPPAPEPGSKVIPGIEAGTHILGQPQAPVTIVEFSDLECPFTRKFHGRTFEQLKEKYIDTGKVRFSYRHLPLPFHTYAERAARTLECAADPEKYWKLFQSFIKTDKLDEETIGRLAREAGIKKNQLTECMTNETIDRIMKDDRKVTDDKGIDSTPTLLINGRVVTGAYPTAVFEKIIEEELGKTAGNEP